MAGRAFLDRAAPGFTLPAFERLAPPPPPELVGTRIEAHSRPGDIVLDLHGRGGWIARAAVDRRRLGVSVETSPLAGLLAELVLRPPDLRHLDAAFSALAASPRGETSLRLAINDLFATRCPTCERMLVADEVVWEQPPSGLPEPALRAFRCRLCRDQRGLPEERLLPLDEADIRRATSPAPTARTRRSLRERFPVPEGADDLPDQLLDLHTPRQLVALSAILERIEGDLRAAPVAAGLRLAFLHAILPSTRLNPYPGRVGSVRIGGGKVRPPSPGQWRERNPWLAFEDGFRVVRGFVQRLEAGALGSVPARFGDGLRALGDGAATAVLRTGGPRVLHALTDEAAAAARTGQHVDVRLVLCQPPFRPSQERLSFAYLATAWALGRDAAATLPIDALAGPAIRAPWGWQLAALRQSLEAVEPLLSREGRAVVIVDAGGAEALATAALAGTGAGYRLAAARLAEPEEESGSIVELVPPGGSVAARGGPGAAVTTRTAVDDARTPGPPASKAHVGAESGLFARPERREPEAFSTANAARTVTDTAVEVLRARGEPAVSERLLGEILVGLDRAGHLRSLAAGEGYARGGNRTATAGRTPDAVNAARPAGLHTAPGAAGPVDSATRLTQRASSSPRARPAPPPDPRWTPARPAAGPDPVERLVSLVRDELSRSDQRRVTEIEPRRWWLADPADRESAASPLADRVEWAVYSLLSTAGPLSEQAFFERIAALFTGHDLPDEALVRTCLESYRSRASTLERVVTDEDLLGRSAEHTELIASLAEGGHRAGFAVWIGRREQVKKARGRALRTLLDEPERDVHLAQVLRGPAEDLEQIDCIWYGRRRAAILWEVEWTAMLGEPVLRRGARIPQDDHVVRFLAVAPERTELLRHKLDRSPLLRTALRQGNWHVLKWPHLEGWLRSERPDLAALEPLLGIDPLAERSGQQMPLFEGG
jgi:hypothetical protein